MPLGLQVKLLRVLETQRVRRLGSSQDFQVNVRVLAASNREPERAVADGKLRKDLYYRLNVFGLKLPPLRERRDDLPLLIRHFLTEFDRRYRVRTPGVREDAMAQICCHSWPATCVSCGTPWRELSFSHRLQIVERCLGRYKKLLARCKCRRLLPSRA
jgi:transcriptional regulator with PAS, ATPase and Fis domain